MTIMTTWTFSSCSDESMFGDVFGFSKLDASEITINAILPENDEQLTRVAYNTVDGKKGLRTKWEEGDKITVYNISKDQYYIYSCHYNEDKSISWINDNNDATYSKSDELVAVFHPTKIVTDVTTTMNFDDQTGLFEDLKNRDLMLSEKVTVTSANIQFHMARKNAFIRIAVKKDLIESYFDTRDGVTLTISGNNGLSSSSSNLSQQSYSRNGNGNITFSLSRQDLFNEKDALGQPTDYYQFYVAVPSYDGRVPITRIRIIGYNRVFGIAIPQNLVDKSFNNGIAMAPGYVYRTKLGDLTEAYLLPGRQFNDKIQELLDGNSLTRADIKKITFINRNEDLIPTSNDVEIQESGEIAYARISGSEIIIFTEADVISANSNSSEMFMDWTSLSQFGDLQLLKTSKTQNMSSMFENCISFRQIDVSTFDTQGVTDMSSMFKGCTNLLTVNTKSLFNTSNVTNMSSMFEGCKSIGFFNDIIANFDTRNVTNMSSMFKDCIKVGNMAVPFDIRNVENIYSMFEGCSNLLTLNLNFTNGIASEKLRNMDAMFKDCVKLSNINFSGMKALKVTSMNRLFQNCEQLKKLDISSLFDSQDLFAQIFIDLPTKWFDNLRRIVSPKEANYMFDSCTRLEELKIGWAFYFEETLCLGAFKNLATKTRAKECTITLSQWCYNAVSNNYGQGNNIGLDTSTKITWINARTGETLRNLW